MIYQTRTSCTGLNQGSDTLEAGCCSSCHCLLLLSADDCIGFTEICSTCQQALLSLTALHSGTRSCANILVLMEQIVCYYLAMGLAVNSQAESCTQGSVVIHLNNYHYTVVRIELSDLLCEK